MEELKKWVEGATINLKEGGIGLLITKDSVCLIALIMARQDVNTFIGRGMLSI